MTRAALALLCVSWLASASPGHAQDPRTRSATLVPGDFASYLTLVERHHPGIADEAVTILAAWGRPAILRASDALPAHLLSLSRAHGPGGALPLLFRVALLHTDAALAARIPEMSADAVFHLDLVAMRLGSFAGSPGCASFAAAWYMAAGGILTESSPLDAEVLTERGLRLFPLAAGLQFAAGAVKEALANPDVQRLFRAGTSPRGLFMTPTEARLEGASVRLRRAEQLFRGALAADPTLVEARLRLGRVLLDQGRLDEARTELERVQHEGGDRFVRYLTMLFLGKVEQRAGRTAGARMCYEAAARVEPSALAPRLALSRLLFQEGQLASALECLAPAMPAGSWALDGSSDPWIRYRLGARRYVPDLLTRLADMIEKAAPRPPGTARRRPSVR
jgi:tetratricopeptide (TPR) repeat protein